MNTLASIAMILFAPSESISSMECELSPYFQNDWDGDMDNTQSGRFLNGLYSIHDNYHEDRKFQWRYCKPASMSPFPAGDTTELPITGYDEVSQEVSRSMETSISHDHSDTVSRTCEKASLYQWVITGTERDSKGAEDQFSAWSKFYLCTDNNEPQCPPGYCLPNEDCTHCKAPFCGNMDSGCSSEIDWAVQEGKWGHPEYYDSFQQVTGVQLYQANKEDMALYFYCTKTKPNGHCEELQMPCTDRVCGKFEACGFIPDSCQSELDWAVTEGKYGHPEFYPHFEENTGIQLSDATKEDFLLYWHCASINPNGHCDGLQIPCNRQCANTAN